MAMKIALCLTGQYRTFDSDIVRKSLNHFVLNKYPCDVYFTTWKHRGISLNHRNKIIYKDEFEEITTDHILKYIPNAIVDIEDYEVWKSNLDSQYVDLLNQLSTTLYSGMIPQLYKKWKINNLFNKQYDWVIVARPDIAYFSSPKIYSNCDNTIWNINPQNKLGYYPNRIYDIYVMGYQESIKKLNSCYLNILNLLDDPFNSGLGSTDVCKMLYIHAKKFNNLDVKSVPDIIGDVYRGQSSEDFINYYKHNNVNVESIQNLL